MLRRTGRPRPGITLLEVLTAIFIMGIGLIAILTLFPAGALSMARAIREDRAAVIAANAAALANAMDLRNDTNVSNALTANAPTNTSGPSNPVLVDPLYATSSPTLAKLGASPGIQRVSPSYAQNAKMVARYFVFQDEIEFDTFGNAKGAPGTVNRPGTYTAAYLIRRPEYVSTNVNSLAELTVIVFAQRPLVVEGETVLTANTPYLFSGQQAGTPTAISGTQGQTSITITYTGAAPDIRRRSWILDASWDNTNKLIAGEFYRVESVSDTGGSMVLDLDRPLKYAVTSPGAGQNVGMLVHFRDIVAVVERGTTWRQ